jgi:hypothetical protein
MAGNFTNFRTRLRPVIFAWSEVRTAARFLLAVFRLRDTVRGFRRLFNVFFALAINKDVFVNEAQKQDKQPG